MFLSSVLECCSFFWMFIFHHFNSRNLQTPKTVHPIVRNLKKLSPKQQNQMSIALPAVHYRLDRRLFRGAMKVKMTMTTWMIPMRLLFPQSTLKTSMTWQHHKATVSEHDTRIVLFGLSMTLLMFDSCTHTHSAKNIEQKVQHIHAHTAWLLNSLFALQTKTALEWQVWTWLVVKSNIPLFRPLFFSLCRWTFKWLCNHKWFHERLECTNWIESAEWVILSERNEIASEFKWFAQSVSVPQS